MPKAEDCSKGPSSEYYKLNIYCVSMASLRISVFTDQGIYWYTNIKQNPKIAAVFKYAQIDSYHLIFSYLCIF